MAERSGTIAFPGVICVCDRVWVLFDAGRENWPGECCLCYGTVPDCGACPVDLV